MCSFDVFGGDVVLIALVNSLADAMAASLVPNIECGVCCGKNKTLSDI